MVSDLFVDDDAQELPERQAPEGELFLKFRLAKGMEVALPAVAVAEVMSIGPDRITPMPNVSPFLLGTLNLRGEIIWVADLSQFFAQSGGLNLDRAEIPVIAVMDSTDLLMGLAVDSIVGTDWLKPEALLLTSSYSNVMSPFVRGEWVIPDNETSLPLLDQVAILRSNRWAT